MKSIRRLLCYRSALACLLVFVLHGVISAQSELPLQSVTYRLAMSRPASHLFEVSIEIQVPRNSAPESLDFQMPKWSPGRYAVFDFAKNVQEVRAVSVICPVNADCDTPLTPVTRIDDQTWRVALHGNKSLTLSYKVFGNDLSGTFSQLNTRHANYNGGSIFMYVVNHKPDPVRLVIDPPKDWRVTNGRTERAGQREWGFPNWDIMADTPTEIAPDWTQDDFQVDGKQYHVVIHSLGSEGGKRPALVRDIEKIVRAETTMWGAPEFEAYTFLIHFAADDHSGDGMEHLTSTQIIEPGALADSGTYEQTLDTVAHEFFHVWNVKRLRPVGLGPWDFTRPANTRGLWVAEGFTNYYGHLMMRRANLWDDTRFLQRESLTITNIENAPGSRLMSAEESSLIAPFIDDAPHAQYTNLENTSISYYPKGELIALVLDLLIRGRSHGKASLDDVMRRMYEEFYLKSANNSYYLRGRGYAPEDLERVASQVAGFDLSDFFRRHVRATEVLPYDEAFGYVGLRVLRPTALQAQNAGLVIDQTPQFVRLQTVRNNSPAEDAGLQPDDTIVSIGGHSANRETWATMLNRYRPGDRVPLTIKRGRQTLQANLILRAPERLDYRIEEKKNVTAEEKQLRKAWLKGGQ